MRHILLLITILLLCLCGCQALPEQADTIIVQATQHEPKPEAEAPRPETTADTWLDLGSVVAAELHNLKQSELGLSLIPGQQEGSFLSQVYHLKDFDHLVASWYIELGGTSDSVSIEFQVGKANHWSSFYSLGEWSSQPRSISFSDALGQVAIDTLILQQPQNQLRFRLILRSDSGTTSPLVRRLAWTAWLEEARTYSAPTDAEVALQIAPRSQFSADPAIAAEICSPVSLAMLLDHYGVRHSSEVIAQGCYDYGSAIYGNWSFAAAYANSLGVPLRVAYLQSLEDLLIVLKQEHPIVCSIAFPNGTLQGAPVSSSPGHLVLVTGFKMIDGIPMLLVNDPAAPNEASVARAYRADQFFAAWNGIVYLADTAHSERSVSK